MRRKRFVRSQEEEKAAALGISKMTLWRYRTGKRKPSPDIARAIKRIDREFAEKGGAAEVETALLDASSAVAEAGEALDRLAVVLKERKKTEG